MCGINGVFAIDAHGYHADIIAMNQAIFHRGPDESGSWISDDKSISFGHQRLSILDLSSNGSQPMLSSNKRYSLIFNGEIYNHIEIRNVLKNQKSEWKGTSDTETLLEAIQYLGLSKTLEIADGMFAFALYDGQERNLFLARDRMGEKPLYFGWIKDRFIFSSELKAFRAIRDFDRSLNYEVLQTYLVRSFIPAPQTIYKNCFKVMPGQVVTINRSSLKTKNVSLSRFWSLSEIATGSSRSPFLDFQEVKDNLRELLISSVKRQMISDVPLGCFLSGGVDSSLVASIMQMEASLPISTFSIGYEEQKFDESGHAKNIANYLGTNHYEHVVTSNEALQAIPKMAEIYDEPFGDSSQIPTFLLSRFVRNHVTVALSGDGGDELFGGYNRHTFSKRYASHIFSTPTFIRRPSIFLLNLLNPGFLDYIENTLFKNSSRVNNLSNLVHKIKNALSTSNSNDLYNSFTCNNAYNFKVESDKSLLLDKPHYLTVAEEMMLKDQIDYLPNDILTKVDRASMAVSLETRAPFLGKDVVKSSWEINDSFKIYNGQGKYILKEILSDFIPSKLFHRPKQGFALPIDVWLRGPLKDWMFDILSSSKKYSEIIDFQSMECIANDHISGKANFHTEIWNLLMLFSWLDNNT